MTMIPIERVIIDAPFSSLLETQNIEVPPTHSILVKVNMCGICTSEQRVFKGTANIHIGEVTNYSDVLKRLSPNQNLTLGIMWHCL